MYGMDLTSKQEAAAVGSKFYFTGKICQNGHIDKRYVSTGICYECKRVNMANDYSRNKPRVIATNKKSYNKNSSKHMARSLAWAKKNPEKRKAIRQKNATKYRDKYTQASNLRNKEKRETDPFYRMCRNTSKAIWAFMKGSKGFRHWELVVGYTFKDLAARLTPLLRDSMTWENYGQYWHIDHIKPLSRFTKDTGVDAKVKVAFALTNLQPLLALENLVKNNKYVEKE